MVEPLGPQAEAKSGSRRLEAETGDLPTSIKQETDRPTATPIHRRKAEDEPRGWQDAATAG